MGAPLIRFRQMTFPVCPSHSFLQSSTDLEIRVVVHISNSNNRYASTSASDAPSRPDPSRSVRKRAESQIEEDTKRDDVEFYVQGQVSYVFLDSE